MTEMDTDKVQRLVEAADKAHEMAAVRIVWKYRLEPAWWKELGNALDAVSPHPSMAGRNEGV